MNKSYSSRNFDPPAPDMLSRVKGPISELGFHGEIWDCVVPGALPWITNKTDAHHAWSSLQQLVLP